MTGPVNPDWADGAAQVTDDELELEDETVLELCVALEEAGVVVEDHCCVLKVLEDVC